MKRLLCYIFWPYTQTNKTAVCFVLSSSLGVQQYYSCCNEHEARYQTILMITTATTIMKMLTPMTMTMMMVITTMKMLTILMMITMTMMMIMTIVMVVMIMKMMMMMMMIMTIMTTMMMTMITTMTSMLTIMLMMITMAKMTIVMMVMIITMMITMMTTIIVSSYVPRYQSLPKDRPKPYQLLRFLDSSQTISGSIDMLYCEKKKVSNFSHSKKYEVEQFFQSGLQSVFKFILVPSNASKL